MCGAHHLEGSLFEIPDGLPPAPRTMSAVGAVGDVVRAVDAGVVVSGVLDATVAVVAMDAAAGVMLDDASQPPLPGSAGRGDGVGRGAGACGSDGMGWSGRGRGWDRWGRDLALHGVCSEGGREGVKERRGGCVQ